MTSELGDLADAMMNTIGGLPAYTYPPAYEIALLSGGAEISGNGYTRAKRSTGVLAAAATWSRSSATISVTTVEVHGLRTGDIITLVTSSDGTAVPTGAESVTVTGDNTFTFTGVAAGGSSGTLDYTGPVFWASDGAGTLTQDISIPWPAAASGGDWVFDEIRFIKPGTSGSYMMRFLAATALRIVDGNTLLIPAGTLVITNASASLAG